MPIAAALRERMPFSFRRCPVTADWRMACSRRPCSRRNWCPRSPLDCVGRRAARLPRLIREVRLDGAAFVILEQAGLFSGGVCMARLVSYGEQSGNLTRKSRPPSPRCGWIHSDALETAQR